MSDANTIRDTLGLLSARARPHDAATKLALHEAREAVSRLDAVRCAAAALLEAQRRAKGELGWWTGVAAAEAALAAAVEACG